MTITVTPRDDDLEEADETVLVTLSLSGQPANVSIGRSTATTKITDGDTLTASVAANEESVVEGAEATFTVTLGGPFANEQVMSTADVVVAYKVNGDVTTDDYTVSSDRLTIPMGTATGVITVATVNDNLSETAEDLMVELTKATTEAGEVEFGARTKTTTILASDGEILVSVRDAGTVDEGEDAKFLVELSGTVSEDLIVNFTTDDTTDDDTATVDTDYTVNDSSLTIEKGERTQTITVATRTDTSAENNETVKVKLTGTQPESAGVNIEFSEATATIRDDDPLTVNLSGPKTVTQGTTSVRYTVELMGGTGSRPVVVTYQEGDNPSATVSIDPPSVGNDGTSNTFAITIDSTREVGEDVVVTLQSVTTAAGRVRLGRSGATTMVTDTVTVSIAARGVDEGDPATFTVTPTGTVIREVNGQPEVVVPIVVSYTTVTGSATGADFKAKSGRLIFTSDSSQSVTVETEGDSRAEENETFSMRLTLVSPRGSVELGTDQITVTIDDDDDLRATVASIQTMVLEGSDATFEVSLTRTETDRGSGSGSRPVVVSYRVAPAPGSTATAADYNAPSGKLTISAGQSSGTIAIPTKADDVLELAGETLALQITGVNTAAGMVTWPDDPDPSAVLPATTTRIRDADGTVVVSVADATPVVEGQAATFTVALSRKVSQPVVVEPTVAPQTQNSGDFTSLLQNLTIAAGETTGIVTVQTTDDADTTAGRQAEADEKFTLTIALPLTKPAGVELGTATATGTIRDDDPLRVNLSGPRAVAATEDAEFTVVLAGGTGSVAVEVGYTCVAGGAEVDCTATGDAIGTGDMTISAGALTGTITVEASQYDVDDVDDRTLEVTLTDVDTVGTVTRGTSRVSTPIVETTISVDDETETEGGTLTFSVEPLKAVYAVVRYNTESGSARSSMDYTPVSGTLTFGSIQGTGTSTTTTTDSTPQDVPVITLRDTPDNLNEGPETLTLRLTLVGRPPGVQIATPTVTGTISDHREDELEASVAAAQDTVPEGSTARFVVTLTGATSTAPVVISTAPVVIKYQLSGDATAEDGDFTAPSGKLTIPAGSASGTIAIQILDDGKLDRGEELVVTLTMGGATSAGSVMRSASNNSNSDSTTIGDASGGVTVSVRDTTADEGEDAVFTVELSGKVSEDVMVEYSTAMGTDSLRGASEDDFTVSNGNSPSRRVRQPRRFR